MIRKVMVQTYDDNGVVIGTGFERLTAEDVAGLFPPSPPSPPPNDATAISYQPGDSTRWAETPPTNVAGALDRLGARDSDKP